MFVEVSVRVPRWVKEVLEKRGVDPSELARRVLVEEAERLREDEGLAVLLEEVKVRLSGRVSVEELVRLIDEERKR